MEKLLTELLSDESARSSQDLEKYLSNSEAFYPWGQETS